MLVRAKAPASCFNIYCEQFNESRGEERNEKGLSDDRYFRRWKIKQG